MDDLLVIIPTRGRPDSIPAILQAWTDTRATADLLFAVDEDDPHLDAYLAHSRASDEEHVRWRIGPRLRLCGTLNAAAAEVARQYRFLAFMGDDHRPRSTSWDARFRECLSGGTGIVYGNDLLMGEQMPTAVAMTSDIVRALGYFSPPALVHLCLDLCWLDWGRGMGRITYLPDVIIEHLHPAAGKAALDQGYEDCNSTERVSADAAAYYAYRDGGGLQTDVAKLQALVKETG
ncbi:glycosyltransferase family 2 protein [Streptomyces klenkii]|uniref:glycosyltransferase family 2 protein n=1 Tax=Streptomyces klenkii TaxID=1420899 RepID=UPI0036E0B80F